MHNIKEIRNDIEAFKEALNKRFLDIDVDKILSLDESNRKYIQEREILEKKKKIFQNQKIKRFSKNLKIFLLRLKKLITYKQLLSFN